MTTQSKNDVQKQYVLVQSATCLFASLLLFSLSKMECGFYLVAGFVFLCFSFFLVIAPFFGTLVTKAINVLEIACAAIFSITLALLISGLGSVLEKFSGQQFWNSLFVIITIVWILVYIAQHAVSALRPVIESTRQGDVRAKSELVLKLLAVVAAATALLTIVTTSLVSLEIGLIVLVSGLAFLSFGVLLEARHRNTRG